MQYICAAYETQSHRRSTYSDNFLRRSGRCRVGSKHRAGAHRRHRKNVSRVSRDQSSLHAHRPCPSLVGAGRGGSDYRLPSSPRRSSRTITSGHRAAPASIAVRVGASLALQPAQRQLADGITLLATTLGVPFAPLEFLHHFLRASSAANMRHPERSDFAQPSHR